METDFLSRILRTRSAPPGDLPLTRQVPLTPFLRPPHLICEIKRASPSRGMIHEQVNILAQAQSYRESGVRTISVLTEPEFFHGSLDDLIQIKRALPQLAVLRKDFLRTEEDIDISWRAGADAVLIIAAILTKQKISSMLTRATHYGMAALVEVHDTDDIEKIRSLQPLYVGVNSRNLKTFHVDPLVPLALMPQLQWNSTKVFESGIHSPQDITLGRAGGFHAFLVGESLMRTPSILPQLLTALTEKPPSLSSAKFWNQIARKRTTHPLVKICGITSRADGLHARDADIIGFVFAPSPRQATAEVVRELADIAPLKVAVVECTPPDWRLPDELYALISEGLIDAIQFHGDEPNEICTQYFPFYKALNPQTPHDLDAGKQYRCPRILLDARVGNRRGGTGTRVGPEILQTLQKDPLWLAGGINPDNAGEIIDVHHPELLDVSSGVESQVGHKDPQKIIQLLQRVRTRA